jgi:hypothetical protein
MIEENQPFNGTYGRGKFEQERTIVLQVLTHDILCVHSEVARHRVSPNSGCRNRAELATMGDEHNNLEAASYRPMVSERKSFKG